MSQRSGSIGISMRRTTALSRNPTSRSRESKPKSSLLTSSPKPSPSLQNGLGWWQTLASALSGIRLRAPGLAGHEFALVSPRNHLVPYRTQMRAQGGTMDGVNANTFHMLIACVVLHARWVLNRLCFAVPANIYIYIGKYIRAFGDDQGPRLPRQRSSQGV